MQNNPHVVSKKKYQRVIKYASFWSSVGIGMTYAHELGFECAVAGEYDAERAEWFKNSYPKAEMIVGDFTQTENLMKAVKLFKDTGCELAILSPNCQPYSRAGGQHLDSPEAFYFLKILEFIRLARPKWVWIENAREFLSAILADDPKTIGKRITDYLEPLGYTVNTKIQNAAEFGAPQSRIRSIVLASREGNWNLPSPTNDKTNWKTAKQTIGHLEHLESGRWSNNTAYHFRTYLPKNITDAIHGVLPGGQAEILVNELKKHRKSIPAYAYARIYADQPCSVIVQKSDSPSGFRTFHYEDDGLLSIREKILLTGLREDWCKTIPLWARCRYQLICDVLGECMMPQYCNALLNELRKIAP